MSAAAGGAQLRAASASAGARGQQQASPYLLKASHETEEVAMGGPAAAAAAGTEGRQQPEDRGILLLLPQQRQDGEASGTGAKASDPSVTTCCCCQKDGEPASPPRQQRQQKDALPQGGVALTAESRAGREGLMREEALLPMSEQLQDITYCSSWASRVVYPHPSALGGGDDGLGSAVVGSVEVGVRPPSAPRAAGPADLAAVHRHPTSLLSQGLQQLVSDVMRFGPGPAHMYNSVPSRPF